MPASTSAAITTCCIGAALLFQKDRIPDAICKQSCTDNFYCTFYALDLNNDKYCYSCKSCNVDAPENQCADVCKPVPTEKKCTSNNQCLLCDTATSLNRVIQRNGADETNVFLSQKCSHLETNDGVLNFDSNKTISLNAINVLRIEGPGTIPNALKLQANTVILKNMGFNQKVTITAENIVAENINFYGGRDDLLIIANVEKNLKAELTNIVNSKALCAGIVNSRGTATIKSCKCKQGSHSVIVQNPQRSPDLVIDADDDCHSDNAALMISDELQIFGREYEIRVFNDGLYERTNELVAYTPFLVACVATLLILLPILHASMWNLFFKTQSKKD